MSNTLIKSRENLANAVVFTTHESVKHILNILKDQCQIIAVVVPINREGTDKIKRVRAVCEEQGIPVVVQPRKADIASFNKFLADNYVTFGISWSYSQIIASETLAIFKDGIWNMHGGKIPEYRGANVLQWAIVNGEKEIGVTWHIMVEQVDAGDILMSSTVPVGQQATALEVLDLIFAEGVRLFSILWQQYHSEGIKPESRDISQIPPYKGRTALDGLILPTMTRQQIGDLIRAQCPPWPRPLLYENRQLYCVNAIVENEVLADQNLIVRHQAVDGEIALSVVLSCTDTDFLAAVQNKLGIDKKTSLL